MATTTSTTLHYTIPNAPAPSPELAALFTREQDIKRAPPRLAISLEALDKCGKTYYALMTAPDPIAVVTNDPGTQAIIDKARAAGRRIQQFDQRWEPPANSSARSESDVSAAEHKAYVDEWNRYAAFINVLRNDKYFRTYVSDTETDVFRLCELAFFGKLMGNARQDMRTNMNSSYSKMFWTLYKGRPDLNIILIHQLKKKYVKSAKSQVADWDGSYETTGFNKISFAVDATIRLGWDSITKDFYSEMDQNKSFRFYNENNAAALGKRWFGRNQDDPSAFWNLGFELFPETVATPEVWGL